MSDWWNATRTDTTPAPRAGPAAAVAPARPAERSEPITDSEQDLVQWLIDRYCWLDEKGWLETPQAAGVMCGHDRVKWPIGETIVSLMKRLSRASAAQAVRTVMLDLQRFHDAMEEPRAWWPSGWKGEPAIERIDGSSH